MLIGRIKSATRNISAVALTVDLGLVKISFTSPGNRSSDTQIHIPTTTLRYQM